MQDVVSQSVEAVAGKELLLPCWSVLTGLWAQLKSCSRATQVSPHCSCPRQSKVREQVRQDMGE